MVAEIQRSQDDRDDDMRASSGEGRSRGGEPDWSTAKGGPGIWPLSHGEWAEFNENRRQAEGLRHYFRILWRGRHTIAACLFLCLAAAILYLQTTPPRYQATTTILIQSPRDDAVTGASVDVRDQIQILRSAIVARRVLDKHGPNAAQTIKADGGTYLERFTTHLKDVAKQTLALIFPRRKQASPDADVIALVRNLEVRHVDAQSRVLEVSYRSKDPVRAADTANAFVNAYIEDAQQVSELERKALASDIARRVLAAKREMQEAGRALNEFKARDIGSNNRYRIELNEFEARASSLRAMHDSLLQRSIDLSFKPRRDAEMARVLRVASVPNNPIAPRTPATVGFAIMLGLMLGIGIVITRNHFASGFRTGSDLGVFLRLPVFGELPAAKSTRQASRPDAKSLTCARLEGAARLVLDLPSSRAVDALALLQASVSENSGVPCVIGITASVAGEGRSDTCLNLATLLSASGERVVIVDADWKRRGLSKLLSGDPSNGLVQVLLDDLPVADVLWKEQTSGAMFLPAGRVARTGQGPNEELAAAARFASLNLEERLAGLSDGADYIIVCLPPMSSASNTIWPVEGLDGAVLVSRAESTPPETIAAAVRHSQHLGKKVVGGLLTNSRHSQARY